jgi:hypothetical protein
MPRPSGQISRRNQHQRIACSCDLRECYFLDNRTASRGRCAVVAATCEVGRSGPQRQSASQSLRNGPAAGGAVKGDGFSRQAGSSW